MDHHNQPKGFFDALPPKQAFWLGCVSAILTIGTLGFILLGGCVLGGDCSIEKLALADTGAKAEVDADEVAADAQPTTTGVPTVTSEDQIRGNPDAAITIIEYSDFQCPYCSRFHPTMQQVMEEYTTQVRWVYRHFPLSSIHSEAIPAANAAECAAEQDKFWEYADALFENQSELGEELYARLANELGLNAGQWQECYASEKYADKITQQAEGGAEAGVTGTPGSFIVDQDGNATPIKGALPFSSIASAIESVL